MGDVHEEEASGNSMGPLAGMRVIDLTMYVQGPLASTMLADLGAEVVKVERAGGGDPMRTIGTTFGADERDKPGPTVGWTVCNRNKRAIALDLYHPLAQQVFRSLLESADIFLTNLQPAALARLGADEQSVRSANPRIIYARGAGYGDRGPLAEEPCQDTVGMAYSGFMFTCSSSADQPYYPPGALSDVMAATTLAAGVLAAVVQRARTGTGTTVTASQLQAMMWLQSQTIASAANLGTPFSVNARENPPNPIFNTYRAGDGQWMALGLPLEHQWPVFLAAVGLTHLLDDPRFADSRLRAVNSAELVGIIEQHLAGAPASHWIELMRAKGLWVAPVQKVQDLVDDPQVQANGYLRELDRGFRAPGMPFTVGSWQPAAGLAPEYGADTDAILEGIGRSTDEITALRIAGAVW